MKAWAACLVILCVAQGVAWVVQPRIQVSGGCGWDGCHYLGQANRILHHLSVEPAPPYGARLAVPFLAAQVTRLTGYDLLDSFAVVNTLLAWIATGVLFVLLRRVAPLWVALVLVAVYVEQAHGLIRFTVWHPAWSDPAWDVAIMLSLFGGWWVVFACAAAPWARELGIGLALIALSRRDVPVSLRLTAAAAGFTSTLAVIWLVGTNGGAYESVLHAHFNTPLSRFVAGWLMGWGPIMAIVLWHPRIALTWLCDHREYGLLLVGVVAFSLVGESQERFLWWGAPVAMVATAVVITQARVHPSVVLAVVAVQAIAQRWFFPLPETYLDTTAYYSPGTAVGGLLASHGSLLLAALGIVGIGKLVRQEHSL